MLGRALGPAGAVLSAIDAPNIPGRIVNDLSTTGAGVEADKPGSLAADYMLNYTRPLRGALSAERHIAGALPTGLSQAVSWASYPIHKAVDSIPWAAQKGIQNMDSVGSAVGLGNVGSNLESIPKGILTNANANVQKMRKAPYGTWKRFAGEMGDSLIKDWIAPNSYRSLQPPKSVSPVAATAATTQPALSQANQVTAGTTGIASQVTPPPPGGASIPKPPSVPGGANSVQSPPNFLSQGRLSQYIGSKPQLSLPGTAKIPQFGS